MIKFKMILLSLMLVVTAAGFILSTTKAKGSFAAAEQEQTCSCGQNCGCGCKETGVCNCKR